MIKYKYESIHYCRKCQKNIPNCSLCLDCGGKFIYNECDFGLLGRFKWIEVKQPFKWWNPISWYRGDWAFDGLGRSEDE